jgi:hypothetical protein
MPHDQVTDGGKRRTNNHPAIDLPSVNGTQLFRNHHPALLTITPKTAGLGCVALVDDTGALQWYAQS